MFSRLVSHSLISLDRSRRVEHKGGATDKSWHTHPSGETVDHTDTNTNDPLIWTKTDGTTQTGPKDAIMASFWAAGRTGTLTRADATPAVLSPTPTVSTGWQNLVVDEEKAEQIAKKEAAIRAKGFVLPDTWFASGTRMLQIGVDNYQAKHVAWAKRPDAAEAMREAAARIDAEDRRDFVVRIGDLRMDADGNLGRKGGPARPMEWGAWGRFYSLLQGTGVLPDGVRLLRELEPATRASVVNERLAAMNPDKEVKIGVRNPGDWSIFRFVSPRYPTDGQGNVLLRGLANHLDGRDFRGEVIYDGTSIQFNAAHMVDPIVLDPVVGDIFRGGIKGKTNDAGQGRFRIVPFAGRVICINCTTMDGYAPGYERIHRGSMEEALEAAGHVAQKALDVLPVFAAYWKTARNTSIKAVAWDGLVGPKAADKITDVSSALKALVTAGEIDHGTQRDALVQHLITAHKAEPGQGTVADLLNAVTRAAHESMINDIQRDVLERQAGALLPLLVGSPVAEA